MRTDSVKETNHVPVRAVRSAAPHIEGGRRRISIEALLVWTHRDLRAHVVRPEAVSLRRTEEEDISFHAETVGTGMALSSAFRRAVDRDEESSVPGNSYAHRREVLPPDAAVVHRAVSALPDASRNIAIRHVVAGTLPSDARGMRPVKCAPIPDGRDGNTVCGIWESTRYGAVHRQGFGAAWTIGRWWLRRYRWNSGD